MKVLILRSFADARKRTETDPMDKKKAISEFHFAHAQNKCIALNDIYFQILFTIVGSLTEINVWRMNAISNKIINAG